MPPLFALAFLGIRILPYAVRLVKAGRKIQQIGYKVIVENPKYLTLAKKIWTEKLQVISARNVKGLTETQILGRFSTSAQRFETVTAEEITKFVGKNAIKSKNISTIANDAGSKISQFVIKHPARPYGPLSQTVERGGATLTNDIKLLFGKGVKLSDKVLKDIKLAESGALALGREVIKAPVKATTAWAKTAKPVIKPVTETAKKIQEFKAAKVGTDIIKTKVLPTERPWYMAIVPKFLRTQTQFRATKAVSTGQPLPETLYKTVEKLKYPRATKAALGVATVAPFAVPPFIPERQPDQPAAKDLDFNALFGKNVTGVQEYEQLKIPGTVGIHDVQR